MSIENLVFGDRSRASLALIHCDGLGELCDSQKGLPVFKNVAHLRTASADSPENQSRRAAILRFFKAWEAGKQSTQLGPIDESKISALLNSSVDHFNDAWGLESTSKPRFTFSTFSDTSPSFTTAFASWMTEQAKKGLNRGHQIVLDLALNRIFSEKFVDVEGSQANGLGDESDSKRQLRNVFEARIHSIQWFREWAACTDPKSKPIDNCRRKNSRSVCTPILLSAEGKGVVMWLTVDLFHDGLGSLAPDIFSLGWSQVALSSNDTDSNELAQQDSIGILQSFDSMWKLSKLGELGFSGRWRITNRPTTSCDASLLEEGNVAFRYISSYKGRSAECAMLVCLLAASGFVYEPVPQEKVGLSSQLPERIPLNPVFAATATVSYADQEKTEPNTPSEGGRDIRSARLGKVFAVDKKCGASARYKLQPNVDSEAPLIDTIVISQADFDEQKGDPKSPIATSQAAEQQAHQSGSFKVRGVHFQPCKTVQDALNWMLSVNQWKRIWNQAKLEAWEKQWDVVRNELGQPISRDLDENGNYIVVPEEQGISTGSIEYMRNPFGRAKKPETVPADEDSSEVDEPEVRME